jgi:hypothetical protein
VAGIRSLYGLESADHGKGVPAPRVVPRQSGFPALSATAVGVRSDIWLLLAVPLTGLAIATILSPLSFLLDRLLFRQRP